MRPQNKKYTDLIYVEVQDLYICNRLNLKIYAINKNIIE